MPSQGKYSMDGNPLQNEIIYKGKPLVLGIPYKV